MRHVPIPREPVRADGFLVHRHFLARLDGRGNLLPHRTAHRQLWQGRGCVALVDGVDLQPFCLGDGDGSDHRYRLRAVCLGGVLDLALFVRIPALALVHPELLRYRVFHGAAVLPAQFVIRNPAVLRCRFAVGCEFGLVVDSSAGIIVSYPAAGARCPCSGPGPFSAGVAGPWVQGFDQEVQQFGILVGRCALHGLLHGLLVALGHLRVYQGQAGGVEDGCCYHPDDGAFEPAHGAVLLFVTAWGRVG